MEKSIKRVKITEEIRYVLICPHCDLKNETESNITFFNEVFYCDFCGKMIKIED